MKTDYFTTFLDTVNNRPTAFSQPVSALPAAAAAAGPGALDINLVLKALNNRDVVPIAELVGATRSSPGTLIATIQQMSTFGLVHYDATGVRLTEQGRHVVQSTPAA
jgi:predicted methyltransferase